MSFPLRLVFANLWLFSGLLKRLLVASPATNALLRTTVAPTIFNAGLKDNILPNCAKAIVNLRLLPGESQAAAILRLRQTIADPCIQVRPVQAARSEPSAVSAVDTPSFTVLQRAIRSVFPQAVVAPSLVLGATDSRHFAPLTRCVYRFSPLEVGPDDLDRVHGTNERISLENYQRMIRFYAALLQN